MTAEGTRSAAGIDCASSMMVDVELAFQLMLSKDQDVAQAAAESLCPDSILESAEIATSRVEFGSLPRSTRTIAMLVALSLESRPKDAAVLGAVPYSDFLVPRGSAEGAEEPLLFAVDPRRTRVDPRSAGAAQAWKHRCAFAIPRSDGAIFVRPIAKARSRVGFRWEVGRSVLRIRRCASTLTAGSGRKTAGERRATFCNLDGRIDWQRSCVATDLLFGDGVSCDKDPFYFDLASGRLAGTTMTYETRQWWSRRHGTRNTTVSIEIGDDLSRYMEATWFLGDHSPRFRLAEMLGRTSVPLPTLGGRTARQIHLTVAAVGTRIGDALKGSLQHHPGLAAAPRGELP